MGFMEQAVEWGVSCLEGNAGRIIQLLVCENVVFCATSSNQTESNEEVKKMFNSNKNTSFWFRYFISNKLYCMNLIIHFWLTK